MGPKECWDRLNANPDAAPQHEEQVLMLRRPHPQW
jgi:hypothetical protein